jgi:hypothetical protein
MCSPSNESAVKAVPGEVVGIVVVKVAHSSPLGLRTLIIAARPTRRASDCLPLHTDHSGSPRPTRRVWQTVPIVALVTM